MGEYWSKMDAGSRKSMKLFAVNGSMGSSRDEGRVDMMKDNLDGFGTFIQDDYDRPIAKSLSAGEAWTKDDIVLLDKNMRVLEYWKSSDSNFAPGKSVYIAMELIRKKMYKKTCNEAATTPKVPLLPAVTPKGPTTAKCDLRQNTKARGGKKKSVGRVPTPCDCHDKCTAFASYMFRTPRPNKNPKSKRVPKGPCWCYPGPSKGKKKGQALFVKKPNNKFVSGAVKKK